MAGWVVYEVFYDVWGDGGGAEITLSIPTEKGFNKHLCKIVYLLTFPVIPVQQGLGNLRIGN
jgi:hypothetical protein